MLLRALTRALIAVAVCALAFTAVNVTLFATAHGIPWPIALLLDPMVALALTIVLYADAHLATWHIQPPPWSIVLRWFTGTAATAMNTWTSLWPDDHIGYPTHADIAAVILHAIPPLLLILLTETIAAYRRHLTHLTPILTEPHITEPQPKNAPAPQLANITNHPQTTTAPGAPNKSTIGSLRNPNVTSTDILDSHDAHPDFAAKQRSPFAGWRHQTSPHLPGPQPGSISTPVLNPPHEPPTDPAPNTTTDHPPHDTSPSHQHHRPHHDSDQPHAADDDLFARARELDGASRALYGRPVSIRRLRTTLHLGQEHARELHLQLATPQPKTPPNPEPTNSAPGQRSATHPEPA